MVAPLVVFIGALAIYPTVLTVTEAFFHSDPLTPPNHFVGLGNFSAVFENPQVLHSIENTGWYALFGVVLTVAFGTGIALLLQRPFRGRGVLLAIVILPWALPGVVEGVIWSWIYNPTFGVLDSALKSAHLIGQYQLFIGSHQIETILLIALVQVWQITPLAALLVLAATQAIPDELYESARVDGANWYQHITRITLPLARPAIAIAAAEALVMSINIFDQVYVLNAAATTGSSLMSQTCCRCSSSRSYTGRWSTRDAPGRPAGPHYCPGDCRGVVAVPDLLGAQNQLVDQRGGSEHTRPMVARPPELHRLSGAFRRRP
jgi:multiple sugar transport system permease protein